MPVYDQGYRRYQGRAPLRRFRAWPITREALQLLLARRAFLLLCGLGFVPFAFRVGQVFLVARFPETERVAPIGAGLFGEFLDQQLFWVLLLSTFAGAGLVANDLRTGAILVYLSRPLHRLDYVVGKLGVLLVLNLAVTLVPALTLYGVALALATEKFLKWELAWIAPAIVLHSGLISLTLGALALAVSSLSRSARVAGVSFFGLVVGLDLTGNLLRRFVTADWASLLSVEACLDALGARLFGASRGSPGHVTGAAAALLLAIAGSLLVLRARVRAVEIVR